MIWELPMGLTVSLPPTEPMPTDNQDRPDHGSADDASGLSYCREHSYGDQAAKEAAQTFFRESPAMALATLCWAGLGNVLGTRPAKTAVKRILHFSYRVRSATITRHSHRLARLGLSRLTSTGNPIRVDALTDVGQDLRQ